VQEGCRGYVVQEDCRGYAVQEDCRGYVVQEELITSASLHKYANDNGRLQAQALVTNEIEGTNRSH
jgi:hypothetical protein